MKKAIGLLGVGLLLLSGCAKKTPQALPEKESVSETVFPAETQGEETTEEETEKPSLPETTIQTVPQEETREPVPETEIPNEYTTEENLQAEETEPATKKEPVLSDALLRDALFYYSFFSTGLSVKNLFSFFDEKTFTATYLYEKEHAPESWFIEAGYIVRDEKPCIRLMPSPLLYAEEMDNDAYRWLSRGLLAFAEITERFSSDERWDNPDSLKPQFICHVIYAGKNKLPWFIEPWRTETNMAVIMAFKANPPVNDP